jgi:hypothetical protein
MSAPIIERLRAFYRGDMGEPADPINPDGPEAAEIITELLALVIQYRDDLRRPPTGDSLERRLAAINAAIARTKGDRP